MKMYVLVEVCWKHDGEKHYRVEDGGGKPLKVFKKKENAEAAAFRLTKEVKWTPTVTNGTDPSLYEVVEVDVDLEELL